ncbi:hypothetical protein RB195_013328 [Necator americanus]|uniref:Uncharacterized protein n=1 Tax=Necator americanus TaxID=51031 RepID=A0ABR1DVF4_NECAM
MATSLKTRKGVLSRHSNSLSQALARHATLGEGVGLEDQGAYRTILNEIQKAEMEIKSLQDIFDRALFAFTKTVDNLKEPLTEEEEAKVSEYISGAHELISQSTSLLIKLEINKEQLTFNTRTQAGLMGNEHPNENTVARIELPKLPIPEFSGKFWQWDSFWELFNATVHSLPLSDLQKFNYLLRALKGEARESIARFQVTSANYNLAIAHLKKRYGNAQNIVTGLHRQLEYWSTRSTQLRDQRVRKTTRNSVSNSRA